MLVGDDDDDDDDRIHHDDDAARWLSPLGDSYPGEFVSAQAWTCPIHRGRWMRVYRRRVERRRCWCRCAAYCHVIFLAISSDTSLLYPRRLSMELAVHAVPPIVGKNRIHGSHVTVVQGSGDFFLRVRSGATIQPTGFSYASVDFVIGADHGQGLAPCRRQRDYLP
jgi:hypothetical protein